eukprot:1376355-Prymnesium_polylepis.1
MVRDARPRPGVRARARTWTVMGSSQARSGRKRTSEAREFRVFMCGVGGVACGVGVGRVVAICRCRIGPRPWSRIRVAPHVRTHVRRSITRVGARTERSQRTARTGHQTVYSRAR